jgi:S1-C subfamily serine protease
VKAGDLITSFNRQPVEDEPNLLRLVGNTRIRDRVPIEIKRDGKPLTFTIEVAEHPT